MEQQPKKVANPHSWTPGKYTAKPVDWMVTKTKEGLPQVSVLFGYEQAGEMPGTTVKREITWYGSFKGGALERTVEALEMLGLREPPYPIMEHGCNGKALDITAEVQIVVEHKVDQQGVLKAGVAWVNRVGGQGLKSSLVAGEGHQVFAAANQAYLAHMQSKGLQLAPRTSAVAAQPGTIGAAANQGSFSEDDIPF